MGNTPGGGVGVGSIGHVHGNNDSLANSSRRTSTNAGGSRSNGAPGAGLDDAPPLKNFLRPTNVLGLDKNELDEMSKPSGLYPSCPWEVRTVRRLIGDGRLAARMKGNERRVHDGDTECPICFLHYSSINVTKCCHANICTECYLQVRPQKLPKSKDGKITGSCPCPFCNASMIRVVPASALSEGQINERALEEARVTEAHQRMRDSQGRSIEVHAKDESEAGTVEGTHVSVCSEFDDIQLYSITEAKQSTAGNTNFVAPSLASVISPKFSQQLNLGPSLDHSGRGTLLQPRNSTKVSSTTFPGDSLPPSAPHIPQSNKQQSLEQEFRRHSFSIRQDAQGEERRHRHEHEYYQRSFQNEQNVQQTPHRHNTGNIDSREWNTKVEPLQSNTDNGDSHDHSSLDDLVVLEAAIMLSMQEEEARRVATGTSCTSATHSTTVSPQSRSSLDVLQHNRDVLPTPTSVLTAGVTTPGSNSHNHILMLSEEEQISIAIAESLKQSNNSSDNPHYVDNNHNINISNPRIDLLSSLRQREELAASSDSMTLTVRTDAQESDSAGVLSTQASPDVQRLIQSHQPRPLSASQIEVFSRQKDHDDSSNFYSHSIYNECASQSSQTFLKQQPHQQQQFQHAGRPPMSYQYSRLNPTHQSSSIQRKGSKDYDDESCNLEANDNLRHQNPRQRLTKSEQAFVFHEHTNDFIDNSYSRNNSSTNSRIDRTDIVLSTEDYILENKLRHQKSAPLRSHSSSQPTVHRMALTYPDSPSFSHHKAHTCQADNISHQQQLMRPPSPRRHQQSGLRSLNNTDKRYTGDSGNRKMSFDESSCQISQQQHHHNSNLDNLVDNFNSPAEPKVNDQFYSTNSSSVRATQLKTNNLHQNRMTSSYVHSSNGRRQYKPPSPYQQFSSPSTTDSDGYRSRSKSFESTPDIPLSIENKDNRSQSSWISGNTTRNVTQPELNATTFPPSTPENVAIPPHPPKRTMSPHQYSLSSTPSYLPSEFAQPRRIISLDKTRPVKSFSSGSSSGNDGIDVNSTDCLSEEEKTAIIDDILMDDSAHL